MDDPTSGKVCFECRWMKTEIATLKRVVGRLNKEIKRRKEVRRRELMTRKWQYWRHHLITGRRFEGETEEMTEMEYLKYLDKWNVSGAGVWQFYTRWLA